MWESSGALPAIHLAEQMLLRVDTKADAEFDALSGRSCRCSDRLKFLVLSRQVTVSWLDSGTGPPNVMRDGPDLNW
jgi:hypothetical protein